MNQIEGFKYKITPDHFRSSARSSRDWDKHNCLNLTCRSNWQTEEGFGWPAVAFLRVDEPEYYDLNTVGNRVLKFLDGMIVNYAGKTLTSLINVYEKGGGCPAVYTRLIDNGYGSKVARCLFNIANLLEKGKICIDKTE